MAIFIACQFLILAPIPAFDVDEPAILTINGVTSPTGLALTKEYIYLTADLLEARPGLFRLTRGQPGAKAIRVETFPLLDLQDMHVGGNGLLVTAARQLTMNPDEWLPRWFYYDLENKNPGPLNLLQADVSCFDGKPECGIVDVVQIDQRHLLGLRPRDQARLVYFTSIDRTWTLMGSRRLKLDGRYGSYSSMLVRDDHLYLLSKSLWKTAYVKLADIVAVTNDPLMLERHTDFSFLKFRHATVSPVVSKNGQAEGFDFDEEGRLWVLLNNRGFDYQPRSNINQDGRPVIAVFETSLPTVHSGK